MSAPPSAPPLSYIATPDTITLGSLFTNPQNLHQNLHDSFPTRTDLPTPIVIKPFGIYKTSSTLTKTSKLRSALTDILALAATSSNTSASELSAPESELHTILNHSAWLAAQCRSNDTRRWIQEQWAGSSDIYLIVGLLVLNNAKLVVQSGVTTDGLRQAQMSFPAGFALAWAGVGPVGGASLVKRVSKSVEGEFEAPGRSVFGVWYWKVRVGWLRSREVESSRLAASTTWRPLWHWRGTEQMAPCLSMILYQRWAQYKTRRCLLIFRLFS
ncbi:uncharacterized protein H6S33_004932 [Morchella sextelata]|uniref:uncharacterized protein n=1 Tax=Morchella sextelata TaxID=1174677 RepID=UPI001D03AE36|nr:uncharacterized protein H6S33_004932 [Morchella sextelata]KAH0604950.1 hypothetical protein H6S33_004932 [Morchella sextelata]